MQPLFVHDASVHVKRIDLSQLRNLYPYDWETILNNCLVQRYFGTTEARAGETSRTTPILTVKTSAMRASHRSGMHFFI